MYPLIEKPEAAELVISNGLGGSVRLQAQADGTIAYSLRWLENGVWKTARQPPLQPLEARILLASDLASMVPAQA